MTETASTGLKNKQKKIALTETLQAVAFGIAFFIAVFLCGVWAGMFSVSSVVEVALGWITLGFLFIYFVCRFTVLHFKGDLTFK